jgi:hypothetical protein
MVNKMQSHKSFSATRSLFAAAAIVVGLALGSGGLTAASTQLSVGPDSVGVDSERVVGPVQDATVITADDHPQVFVGADKARDSFGFPVGVKKIGRHVRDGYQKSDYDEVAEVGANGQTLSLTQFDDSGRLMTAVRFDTAASQIARVTGDVAVKVAQHGLAASGLSVTGQARMDSNSTDGGWDVHWDRVAEGLTVRGDEVRAHVWADGRIQTVARVEHALASAPTRSLSQTDARKAATRQLDQWSGSAGTGYTVTGLDIEWVGPNAAFDATKLNDAPAPYRMAWVVNAKPTGESADYIRLVTLYVDAGNGTVIGGDVVE